jgi:hypothetical protein
MVDENPYGEIITANDEPKCQINLPPGKHECYLERITPKNKNDEIVKSNVLVCYLYIKNLIYIFIK